MRVETRGGSKNNKKYLFLALVLLAVALCTYVIFAMTNSAGNFGDQVATEANFESLPDRLDNFYLKSAIITKWSKDEHLISTKELIREEYKKGREVNYDTVFFSVSLNDLNAKDPYVFDKNTMNRIVPSELHEGDLVYYYTQKDDKKLSEDIRAIILVKQDERIIDEPRRIKYMRDVLELDFDSRYYEMANIDGKWLAFENGVEFIYDYEDDSSYLFANDFYDSDEMVKFKYIPSAWNSNMVELTYLTEIDRIGLEAAKSEIVNILSIKAISDKNDDTKSIERYELEVKDLNTGKKSKVLTSDIVTESTLDILANGKISKEDELAIYTNPMNRVELIRIKDQKNQIADKDYKIIRAIIGDDKNYSFDRKIRHIEVFGGEKVIELMLDANIVENYNDYSDLEYSLCEFKVSEGGYVEDLDVLIDSLNTTHLYRLLDVRDGKINLGYNNFNNDGSEEFDINEQQWLELADDYKFYSSSDSLDKAIGRDISITLNSDAKVQYIISLPMRYTDCYDVNSPLDMNASPERTLSFAMLVKKVNDYQTARFSSESNVFGKSSIDEDTKCFVYDYDFDEILKDSSDWNAVLNHDFKKVRV
jgi:hypothetical protein